MFYQISLSPQVKRSAIIRNKYGIYELPHELPNNLRLVKTGKCRNFIELEPSAQSTSQNKNFVDTSKTFPHFAVSHED